MKLPEKTTVLEEVELIKKYGREVVISGEQQYINKLILHNETIAAQLILATVTNYARVSLTDKDGNTIVAPHINVQEGYRDILDKLNKGEL